MLVSDALSEGSKDLIRANSLKMVYAMLRDNKNLFPKIQERLLRKYVEMQTQKLRKVSNTKDSETLNDLIEAHNELLAAHKELAELASNYNDKYALLT